MAIQRFILIITTPFLLLLLLLINIPFSESSSNCCGGGGGGVRAAYWPSGQEFKPSSVNTKYFTHIYYAFIQPNPETFKLDITEQDQKWIPQFIKGLRYRNPAVKTLLSLGGGGSNATLFSEIASKEKNRKIFIDSTIHVARNYGFDGIDLDWEFPRDQKDMFNLGVLYEEWYHALSSEAHHVLYGGKPRLLLTSAVYYNSTIRLIGNGPRSYPAQPIRKYLDWASPMCFDYHGSWANETGFNAALYDPHSEISTKFGIGSWIKSGVPGEKLVMGLALYGRTWELKDPNVHGVGAEAVGPATDTDGSMDYHQIVDFNSKNAATVVYHKVAVSFYSYAGTTWISYDDGPSIKTKVGFAKSMGLKGYFFWALGKDKDWTISKQASSAWGH